MKRATLLVFAIACGDHAVVVEPIFEGPVDDDDATATGLDNLTLSIAHQGSLQDLELQNLAPGALAELTNVPFADDLVIHLTGRIGGGDVAYGRTCSFALAASGPPPEPHLFFSRSVKFASLGVTSFARVGGAALTYHDGSALLLGGSTGPGGEVLSIEQFDPRTGELHVIATLDGSRSKAVATVIGIGNTSRIAMIGGDSNGSGADFVELLEVDAPELQRIEKVPDSQLAMARIDLTATTLTDGRVVAIGGIPNIGGAPSGVVAEITSVGGAVEIHALAAVLAHPRARHTATRLGDDVGAPVLVVGGVDATGAPVGIAELFKPLSGDLANPATFAPAMVVPRREHKAKLMPDGSVLFIGGLDATNAPVRTLERFTLDAGFVDAGLLPLTAGVIDMTVTTLPDGRVLLAGGRTTVGGPAVGDAFIARLDVIDGSVDVVATDKLAVPRAGHQATLMCDGTVLVTGGTEGSGQTPIERYNPPPLGRR